MFYVKNANVGEAARHSFVLDRAFSWSGMCPNKFIFVLSRRCSSSKRSAILSVLVKPTGLPAQKRNVNKYVLLELLTWYKMASVIDV